MAATDTFHSLLGIFSGNNNSAQSSAPTSNGQINMNLGAPVGTALSALSMVPGPVGFLGTLGSAFGHLSNAAFASDARRTWGQPGLNFGQYLGSAFGLNSYAQGGPTNSLGQFHGVDVAPGGMVTDGGFMGTGIGSTDHLGFTPQEAQNRFASANTYGVGPVSSGQIQANAAALAANMAAPAPTASPFSKPSLSLFGTPMQSRTIASSIDASNSSDPIGDLINGLGIGGNGGGNYGAGDHSGPGGGYGGRADTGRSGADTGNRSSIN